MQVHNLDYYLITQKENIFYLTGLTQNHPNQREAILILAKDDYCLYHSPLITIPPSILSHSLPYSPARSLTQVFQQKNFTLTPTTQIGIEPHNCTVAEYDQFNAKLAPAQLISIPRLIETLRLIKDLNEIKNLIRAGQITRRLMSWAISTIKTGAFDHESEFSLVKAIEHQAHLIGGHELSFPIIVAVGKNTALPHHSPGKTKITPGKPILIDLGVSYHQYCSDMTRTFWYGDSPPPPQFVEIEKIVKTAHNSAISLLSQHYHLQILTGRNPKSKLKPPKSRPLNATHIDKTVRTVIEKAGFGNHFIHTTGHGLGLEIHEPPSLNSKNNETIKPGMTITIEPGVYIKGHFGYRHENTVLI